MDLVQKKSHKEEQISQKEAGYTFHSQISNQQRRKNPQLIRINADNQSKQFLCKFWIIFLLFILVLAIISTTLPKSFINVINEEQLKGTSLDGCLNPSKFINNTLACQDFSINNPVLGFISRNLKTKNQFIIISLYAELVNISAGLNISQEVTYTVYDLKQSNINNGTSFVIDSMHQHQTTGFNFNSESGIKLYGNDGSTLIGYIGLVGVARYLTSENLYLSMSFDNYGSLNTSKSQFHNVASIYLKGFKVNPRFTNFTIGIRYFYFALAIIALFLFIRNLGNMNQKIVTIQQKLIKILAVLLLFFNDPLYPITILKPNMFSSFLSTIFVITFIVFLLFLWLVFAGRIFQSTINSEQSYRKIKVAYSIIFYTLLVTLYMLYASYSLNDHPIVPTYDLSTGKYLGLEVVTCLWGIIGIAYIVIQFIRTCFKQGNLLWRHEMFIVYSVLYIFAIFIFFVTSNSLGSFSYNGSSILFLYSLMNMYTWYLMYMFSPSSANSHSFQPQVKSQQGISQIQGTIQLNDVNIDLDRFSEKQHSSLKNMKQDRNQNWEAQIKKRKQQQKKVDRGFQIQSQFNQEPKHIIEQPIEIKKVQQVDFFDQKQVNDFKNTHQQQQKELKKQDLYKVESTQKNKEQKAKQIQSDFGQFQLQ